MRKVSALGFVVVISLMVSGCVTFNNYADLKNKLQKEKLYTKTVDTEFSLVKERLKRNMPRCFTSSQITTFNDCEVNHEDQLSFEMNCFDTTYSHQKELKAYVYINKIDSTHTQLKSYGKDNSLVIFEWAENVHQLCPSVL